jgi:hypothetical protein
MNRLPLLLVGLLLALAVPALAACGEAAKLDTAKVEEEVQELAEDEDIQVDSVTCPEGREAKDGDEFECDIETEDNVEIEAEVEQTSDDGDVRVRIASDQIAEAQAGAEEETDTAPEGGTTTEEGGAPQGQDASLIEQAIRSYVTAARDGDAETFCGQQSDPRLERRYGGIQECVASDEAQTPAPSIPSGDSIEIEIESIQGTRATAQVSRPGGSTSSTYEMVNEGGQGGWAVESIDGE